MSRTKRRHEWDEEDESDEEVVAVVVPMLVLDEGEFYIVEIVIDSSFFTHVSIL